MTCGRKPLPLSPSLHAFFHWPMETSPSSRSDTVYDEIAAQWHKRSGGLITHILCRMSRDLDHLTLFVRTSVVLAAAQSTVRKHNNTHFWQIEAEMKTRT
eukprot:TRINITY_DN583_c0_g1_i1.p1 TRINITY_DN583_c0_g1~~TRINITY_DN583_c0_g1_i1.p1  ORF type:complete len:100 (+),score=7.03 TRINITY_DN583_c0_g1_i1:520-819(+)